MTVQGFIGEIQILFGFKKPFSTCKNQESNDLFHMGLTYRLFDNSQYNIITIISGNFFTTFHTSKFTRVQPRPELRSPQQTHPGIG